VTGYLIDTSVINRLNKPRVKERIAEIRAAGSSLYRCTVIDIEVLYSASARTYPTMRSRLASGFRLLEINQRVMERALAAQAKLALASQHRRVKTADLTIAACAETHGVAVLHYDSDYDALATVMNGLLTEWVVPRGTVDS
jgi:predicted nucleic acid-binding protein